MDTPVAPELTPPAAYAPDGAQDVPELLDRAARRGAIDVLLAPEVPPGLRLPAGHERMDHPPIAGSVLTQWLRAELAQRGISIDETCRTPAEGMFILEGRGGFRFRVTWFWQRGELAAVVRAIPDRGIDLDSLGLPPVLRDFASTRRGLVLVASGAGHGRSWTIASMIAHRAARSHGHITSIEGPIEIIHRGESAVVTQREVGRDAPDRAAALALASHLGSDVLVLADIDDEPTLEAALAAVDDGVLVIGGIRAHGVPHALERLIGLASPNRRDAVLKALSERLKGVVAQQLLPREDGAGCAAAVEVLVNVATVSSRIAKGEFHTLREVMSQGRGQSMRALDWAIFDLYNKGVVGYEDAVRAAVDPRELQLSIRLRSSRGEPQAVAGAVLDPALTAEETARRRAEYLQAQEEHRKAMESALRPGERLP